MDIKINSYKQYIKDLLILAFPLFIGNLGHTLLGFTDVLVVSKYSIDSLSAIGIANSLIITIMILGIGILTAVSIILSNMRGGRSKIKKYLTSTLFLSLILSAFFSVLCYMSKYFVSNLNFEDKLIPYINEYISIISLSLFGGFLFEGIKQFLLSYEIVKFPNIVLFCSVFLNLVLDIIFVFGFGIIPPMGSKGAAIATLIVRFTMGLSMLLFVFRFINFKSKIDFSYMKTVIKTGLPIGIALLFEFLAFNIVTVLAGLEESILAAVHSILITLGAATFMVPLAISTALSVKVAYYFGAKKPIEIKKYSYAAIFMILSFMILISLLLAVFPKQIISIFTSDTNVMTVALPLISIVAAYQIFDGFQVATSGILKGFKLTKTVSITVLSGYWLIGAPCAYVFVSYYKLSLQGYWLALALALLSVGLIQSIIARAYYKKFEKEFNTSLNR